MHYPIERPGLHDIYRTVIEGILFILAMSPADSYVFGQEAFEKWADTLLDESCFAGKTDDELVGICWDLYCSPYCNICTSAADAIIRAASEIYNIYLTKKLLSLYEKFIQLRQERWALHGDFFPQWTSSERMNSGCKSLRSCGEWGIYAMIFCRYKTCYSFYGLSHRLVESCAISFVTHEYCLEEPVVVCEVSICA